MKFFSENHSGHVNIDSGTGSFFHPFQPGIHIHIPSESVFTSLRNDYSHAPESAAYEAARQNIIPKLSLSTPAARYGVNASERIGGR
jgi:hypothetical protein